MRNSGSAAWAARHCPELPQRLISSPLTGSKIEAHRTHCPLFSLFVFHFSLLVNRVEVFLPLHLSTTYSFYMCCTHTIVNLGSVSGERNGIFPLTGCLRFSFGIVLILPTMLVSNTCLVVGLSHYVYASGSSFLLLLKFAGWYLESLWPSTVSLLL